MLSYCLWLNFILWRFYVEGLKLHDIFPVSSPVSTKCIPSLCRFCLHYYKEYRLAQDIFIYHYYKEYRLAQDIFIYCIQYKIHSVKLLSMFNISTYDISLYILGAEFLVNNITSPSIANSISILGFLKYTVTLQNCYLHSVLNLLNY